MKKTEQVQEREGNIQNTPGKASMPAGNVNDTGVKNGVGIPAASGNKSHASAKTGNNSRKIQFSNERPIF